VSLRSIARRACFSVAYHLYARPKIERTDRARVMGYLLEVPPGVFHPALYFSSKTLGAYLRGVRLDGKAVLDMGSGSGFLSLIAADAGAAVTAIDANPAAVEATRVNASRAHLQVRALQGDLFQPLGGAERFDYIVFNPPFYTGKPETMAAMAWHGGADYQVVRGFFSLAHRFLSEDGSILFILSSDMGIGQIAEIVISAGYSMRCVRSKKLFFEEFFIYEARPANRP
jgi:release factor glutamine methyltransferase